MTDKIWWFNDYETNLIHKFDRPDQRIAHCGISKVDDITCHGRGHAPFYMFEERMKQSAGGDFGYPCPECCNKIIVEL